MLLTGVTPVFKAMDDWMIAAMRLALAAVALAITCIDPSEPARYVVITYAALVLYVAYSVILYVLARRQSASPLLTMAHWVDTGWYGVLIGLSGGTNSIFFFFFFFAILVASFQRGFASGVCVTLVAVVLSMTIGYTMARAGEVTSELNRFLLRPISLLVLGSMVAYWGDTEITLKRRLALLKDIGRLSNPRFGVDQTLGMITQRLRTFYDADACLLITAAEPATGGHSMRRADRGNLEASVQATPVPAELGRRLLALPAEQGLVYGGVPYLWGWWRPTGATHALETAPDGESMGPAQISGLLAAESFVTVPFRSGGEVVGRLYLTASRRRAFEDADVDFLFHVLDHTIPILDDVQLVSRLAAAAAATERQRLARDLHDGVIQPCIGLCLGLAAIKQKLLLGSTDTVAEIEQLVELSDAAIVDLRRCVGELRGGSILEGGLLPALQRLGKRFAEATGIAVHIESEGDPHLHDRLAAEVLQMVAEGLSNVRRHTPSPWATVGLACHDGHLTVRIENEGGDTSPAPFTPRSIAERAAALGGCTRIARTDTGRTVVLVDIPL